MLRTLKNKISGIGSMKKVILLLCTVLILAIGIGTSFSYVITGTPTLVNLFFNGMNPDGDLVIQKMVSHPFGDTYSIPLDLTFSFEVDLGEEYAGKTLKTTQGEKTADEYGFITVTVAPGGRTTVYDIDDGTAVTVTETNIGKGFTPDAVSQEITVQKHQNNTLAFANTYVPDKADTSALTVSGIKTLAGREWTKGDSFTFGLELNEAGTWTSLGTKTITYEPVEQANPENPETVLVPKPDFDKFDFSELIRAYAFDEAGTYSFRVSEVEGTIGGLTYDKAESNFDILVGDKDMDGYLEIQSVTTTTSANTTVENTTISITFQNKYAPVGSTEAFIEIRKVLEDASGQNKSPAGYTFELYDEENNRIATSDPTGSTGETSIRLVYEPTDAGKTFTYILKETGCGQTVGALTYDDTEYKIQVSVIDNLDGTVSAYVYDCQTPVEVVQDTTPAEATETTETTGTTETTETVQTVNVPENTENTQETCNGSVSGSNISVSGTAEATTDTVSTNTVSTDTETIDTGTTGTVSSSNLETTKPADSSVSTEPESTEPENSALLRNPAPETAAVTIPEGATDRYKAAFTNKYDPQNAATVITGSKALNGRTLRDGEFTFQLYKTDELFTMPDDAQPMDTAHNDADGAFAFDALTFDKVGTYYYVVTEDASGALGGVTYDGSRYLVTIVVTDVDGVLTSETSVRDGYGEEKAITFVNSYQAAPVSLPLGGRKTLSGAKLKDHTFRFQLHVADEYFTANSTAFQTVANGESGEFSFIDLSFTKAGTYRYVVTEDSSDAVKGMTYDDTVYQITVVVEDPGDGQLVISQFNITADGESVTDILFKNTYTKPTEPIVPDDPEDSDDTTDSDDLHAPADLDKAISPETDDNSSILLWFVIMVLSAAAVLLLVFGRHKKERR